MPFFYFIYLQDKLGGTMVSYAIEQFNLGILEILVEQEYCECNLNLRVRESDEVNFSIHYFTGISRYNVK